MLHNFVSLFHDNAYISLRVFKWSVDLDLKHTFFVLLVNPGLVLNVELDFEEFDRSIEFIQGFELDFDDEEELTWHSITIRINGTLQHFKLTLRTDLNAIFYAKRSSNETRVFDTIAHVVEVGYLSVLDEEPTLLQVFKMQSQKLFQTCVQVDVVLLVWRSVQKQCIVTFAEDIFVVLKHHLSVSVWMQKWNDVKVVHLPQKLRHIGARSRREEHKLQVNSLHFGLLKSHLVFEQLEQNVVLM